jgi:two-component system, LytTR family, response regulator
MLRCIVIDDEPLAREGIEEYIAKVSFLEWAGSYENALLAGDALLAGNVDLMFLDIHMPHLTGIEFLKSLKNPPLAIFHTAYPTFALEGYQLDVIDYLVKPIAFDRFFKAATKAHEFYQLKNRPAASTPADPKILGTPDFLFIKTDKRYEKVRLADILFVEAMQNYSIVQTNKQRMITLMSLKSFEDLLPRENFLRVQKSFIVALDKIDAFEGNQIKVGNKMIPLSKPQRDLLFNRLVNRNTEP